VIEVVAVPPKLSRMVSDRHDLATSVKSCSIGACDAAGIVSPFGAQKIT
jgi:hypothetical protein